MFEKLGSLENSFGTVGIVMLVLFLLVIATAIGLRYYLKAQSEKDLTGKYKGKKWASPLDAHGQYPDVNSFKFSGMLTKFGGAIALAAVLFAFSATSFEKEVYIPDGALELDEEIEVEPPRTAEPPPPPPPPPPPVIEEVPEEEIEEEDEPEFLDQDVEEETIMEELPEVEDAPPPPPPPPPPAPEEEEVFMIVEQSPRFPGCEDMSGSKEEKEACAQKKMLEYIYGNLKYPAIARENGIEGQVVIQFVVAKDGSIEDIQLVRDLEGGCGEAAVKIVRGMNNLPQKWTPGKQRGRPVKVKYTLPVKFKLEG